METKEAAKKIISEKLSKTNKKDLAKIKKALQLVMRKRAK